MRSKAEVRGLLKSGLTGREAGLLVFEDSWLLAGRSGGQYQNFLEMKDIESLKARLGSQKDIDDYNIIVRVYRVAEYIRREAETELFIASSFLDKLVSLGFLYERGHDYQAEDSRKAGAAPARVDDRNLLETHNRLAGKITGALRRMLARRQVLQELGRVIGLALEEELDLVIEVILRPSLDRYSKPYWWPRHRAEVKLPQIKLEKCKPRAEDLARVRSWLVEHLGEDWWQRSASSEQRKSLLQEFTREYWKDFSETPVSWL
jgi:hypothetical protein